MIKNDHGYHAYAYFAIRQEHLAKSQQIVRPGKEQIADEVIARSTYGGGKTK